MMFFDVIGGVVAPILIFFLPAVFYLKCQPDGGCWTRYLGIQHIAFTLLGAIASIYQVITGG
jgi:hypothetical protein